YVTWSFEHSSRVSKFERSRKTPLVRIDSLSDALGVEILGKAEFLNPGGSVKDRVALRIIEDAERQGEGERFAGLELMFSVFALRASSTKNRIGVIIANIARRAAIEFGRSDIMRGLEDAHANHELHTGSASVVVTTTSSHVNAEGTIDDPLDEDLLSKPRGFFADQFENRSNFEAHYNGTGPEIWRQTNSHIDAFVSGAGTGGTIAGMLQVKHGVMYDRKEAEGTKRRHQVDTVVEGIGINRMTNNIHLAIPIIDDAFRITDVEAVAMSRYLVQNDGLFLGSSSACNLVACIKFVKKRGWRDGETLVTIL
ncbi:tryptophan synthase beta subunit-like PLP-dependent enzyme, partial [Suillus subluteus]